MRGSETTQAIQNFASAKYNQINSTREACNLESVVGGLGAKGVKKEGGIRELSLPIQSPLSPLEKTLSQATLEFSQNAQSVESLESTFQKADSSTAQSPESTAHTAQTSSTIQHSLAQETRSALSAKRKRFIPSRSQSCRSPLNPKKNKATAVSKEATLSFCNQGESLAISASSIKLAGDTTAPTPSLRGSETTQAFQNFASAKYNQINSTREACNLESVVGGLGGQRGDKGGDFAIQAPCAPLERLYPKRH